MSRHPVHRGHHLVTMATSPVGMTFDHAKIIFSQAKMSTTPVVVDVVKWLTESITQSTARTVPVLSLIIVTLLLIVVVTERPV